MISDDELDELSKRIDIILVQLISENRSIDPLTLTSLILARLAMIHATLGTTNLYGGLLKLILEERILEILTDDLPTKKSIH